MSTSDLDRDFSFPEFVEYLADGHKGAEHVITDMLATSGPRTARTLNYLDDLNIRGEELWKLYKACHRDIWELFEWVEREKGK